MTSRIQRQHGPMAGNAGARVFRHRANVGPSHQAWRSRTSHFPQPPEWLRNVLAMPVPQLSTAFDPQTGRRIVPYEPLINWTRPYPSVDQNVRGPNAAGAYGPEIGAMPGPSSLEAPAIKQSAPLARPERPADINIRPDPAHPTVQEPNGAPGPSRSMTTRRIGSRASVNAGDPWRDVVQPGSNRRQLPQEQQTRPSNVPETTFSKDPVGIQPTPLIGPRRSSTLSTIRMSTPDTMNYSTSYRRRGQQNPGRRRKDAELRE